MAKRSREELDALAAGLYQIVEQLRPMTIRSLFYRAVSAGLVAKTEHEYKGIVRITGKMRKQRIMPFEWLVDAGRFVRQANLWPSPQSILKATQDQYRYDRWIDQENRVEIWVEKDAVVGVIEETCEEFGVPLYSCKGYPSLSLIDSAIRDWPFEKNICVRYFGDHDPSGMDIPRYLENAFYEIGVGQNTLDFEVRAVTQDQIYEYDLPTRPTKRTDSRSANFEGESVELDAFDPNDLRELVSQSIQESIDDELWAESGEKEEEQHQKLNKAIDDMGEI